jgi:hypothetical protein
LIFLVTLAVWLKKLRRYECDDEIKNACRIF